ncbi:hypothetical protein PspLS_04346 [Pyricularia sp. CBS 133598]|nr:hypothetical protein PspLS_04346 [Pyricularia sp. CBS 133598]
MKFNALFAPTVIALALLANQTVAFFFFDDYVCQITVYYPGKTIGRLMRRLIDPKVPIIIPKINGTNYYAISDNKCKYRRYDKDPEGNPWPSGLRVKGVAVNVWKEKMD